LRASPRRRFGSTAKPGEVPNSRRLARSRTTAPAHRGTTVELRTLYPFVVPPSLGVDGCYIGREASGAIFCFDPWECYANGSLTSPNMVVMGQIGRGKSAFVKSFVWRQRGFGRQCWVLDPKGEYGPLAHALGSWPLALAPGLGLVLNPLDVDSTCAPGEAHRVRSGLLAALLASSLGRPLLPAERAACDVALAGTEASSDAPTLGQVGDRLLNPGSEAAVALGTDLEGLRSDGRQVALELRRLVQGDLAGMFDGPTSPGAGLSGGFVVLDLSRLYSSPALGRLMVCALSWLQSALSGGSASANPLKRLLVLDEAWAVLSHLETARWLQGAFKLSRSYGVANVAVVHRVSDLRAAGDEGSERQRLAEGLLADAETRVIFAQAPGEVDKAAGLLGLNRTESAVVGQLPRGCALWRVGQTSYLVEHRLSPEELALADTDKAMRDEPRPFHGSGARFSGTGG
jgi:hypothetical protein